MTPEVGDIWYCTYNDAYLLVMDVSNENLFFRWLDTWEDDMIHLDIFQGLRNISFDYKKVA